MQSTIFNSAQGSLQSCLIVVVTGLSFTKKVIPTFFAHSPKHEAFMLGTSKTRLDSKGFDLFITTAPIPDMNDKLTVFGRVIKGEDVVQVTIFVVHE